MNQIEKNYLLIQANIAKLIENNNLVIQSPTLIAVTKKRSIAEINTAYKERQQRY